MVTQKIYITLGKMVKGKYKVSAALKPDGGPMWNNSITKRRLAIPTVKFAIEVNVPDEKFNIERMAVAKINLALEQERLIVRTVEAL